MQPEHVASVVGAVAAVGARPHAAAVAVVVEM